MPADELVATYAPTLQRYLEGRCLTVSTPLAPRVPPSARYDRLVARRAASA